MTPATLDSPGVPCTLCRGYAGVGVTAIAPQQRFVHLPVGTSGPDRVVEGLSEGLRRGRDGSFPNTGVGVSPGERSWWSRRKVRRTR